jgi:BolA protein
MSLTQEIRTRLSVLAPESLEIQDDSALHAGHQGHQGGGHFTVTIVSSQFSGKSHIIRHRTVYQALADLIPKKIHALSIRALTPDELN